MPATDTDALLVRQVRTGDAGHGGSSLSGLRGGFLPSWIAGYATEGQVRTWFKRPLSVFLPACPIMTKSVIWRPTSSPLPLIS